MRAKIIIILLFLSVNRVSPSGFETGLFGGTSYYIGNINTSTHFYSLSPAAGAIFKYNFNDHYSLRANFNFGRIRADDLDFKNPLHQTRNARFINNFYDFSLQGEFNFLPFRTTIFRRPVSTYVTAGLAWTIMDSEGYVQGRPNLPFGVGVKYGFSRRATLGMEWALKKNFSDNIDGVRSFGQFNSPSLVHNNDWVSLAGIFLTVKPFERRGDCPVYRY
jgi:hypothetical protein